jgi:hypothetical protein
VHPDGGGLYLQVTESKTKGKEPGTGKYSKSWIFRYRWAGREREMGLGSLKTIGLKDAREDAEQCRKLLREGKDPIEVRNAERAAKQVEAAKSVTFERCATAYMAAHEAGWRNAKHRQTWHSTLSTYVCPIIGKLPVQMVDTGLVMKILTPIWTEKNETASRVRAA